MRLALTARNSLVLRLLLSAIKQKHPEHEQPGSYVQTQIDSHYQSDYM
jgi:hypothetical protein